MWKTYRQIAFKYPKISLEEERRLIAQAKKDFKEKVEGYEHAPNLRPRQNQIRHR